MSQLERTIEAQLEQHRVRFEPQKEMPLDSWPWKRPRSHQPKCDFFLPEGDIYVEVKGFMFGVNPCIVHRVQSWVYHRSMNL